MRVQTKRTRTSTARPARPIIRRKTEQASPPRYIEDTQSLIRGPGQPLDAHTRAFMEPRFGVDLSQVRIHAEPDDARSARQLHARAFTIGSDIGFAEGEYNPSSAAGKRLLAHELAHVAQQADAVSPSPVVRRTIGDGHDLTAPRFITPGRDKDLEDTFDDDARLTIGNRGREGTRKVQAGEAVRRVQEALIELGFLPVGAASGVYTEETWEAVKQLKKDKGLGFENMGDVGPGTMDFLNRHFTPSCPPCPEDPRTPGCSPCPPTACPPCPEDPRTPGCSPCPPVPVPPTKVCGPDVSAETSSAWASAQSTFDGLSFTQKFNNCRMLVQPIVDGRINQDAFDTWGLFQGSAGWTRVPPWHGSCGSPGSTGALHNNFDPLHEDSSVCSNTVKIGSDCWLSGTPNYGLFGIAMRACSDFTDRFFFLPGVAAIHPLFSLLSTMALVGAYKLVKGDNIVGPEKWASATWVLGPSATASGGNRAGCSPTCAGPAPPRFLIVWEPNMPRSGMPGGPPYSP